MTAGCLAKSSRGDSEFRSSPEHLERPCAPDGLCESVAVVAAYDAASAGASNASGRGKSVNLDSLSSCLDNVASQDLREEREDAINAVGGPLS